MRDRDTRTNRRGFGGPGEGRAAFGGWPDAFGPPFPPRGRGGRGGRGGGRGRARRGDVRAALLGLLVERPMHGYEMIQELGERTGGMWQPSAGSVYPTLQLLEDEGLVTSTEADGKRKYALTDAGRREVEERTGAAPWDEVAGGVDPEVMKLREQVVQTLAATKQVAVAGNADQRTRAAEVLAEARRNLYAILSEDA